jgi:hypothetical protein
MSHELNFVSNNQMREGGRVVTLYVSELQSCVDFNGKIWFASYCVLFISPCFSARSGWVSFRLSAPVRRSLSLSHSWLSFRRRWRCASISAASGGSDVGFGSCRLCSTSFISQGIIFLGGFHFLAFDFCYCLFVASSPTATSLLFPA